MSADAISSLGLSTNSSSSGTVGNPWGSSDGNQTTDFNIWNTKRQVDMSKFTIFGHVQQANAVQQ